MIAPEARRDRPRPYHRSGVYRLKRAVLELGSRALPSRKTALGRALREWRASLIGYLGGETAISTQQVALVDLALRTKLLVDSVDAYVLHMDSPVNKRKRSLHPVVRERQSLVSQLQSLLRDLGLERRAREVTDLTAYLATQRQAAAQALPPAAVRSTHTNDSQASPTPKGGETWGTGGASVKKSRETRWLSDRPCSLYASRSPDRVRRSVGVRCEVR